MEKLVVLALALALAVSATAADIDNGDIVAFANEKARVVADLLSTSYGTCLSFKGTWDTNPDWATICANIAASRGSDGANTGGSTTFTSASGTFATAQIGHSIYIKAFTGGTCVVGRYTITARASASSITLASSPCSVTGSGITYEVGDFIVDGSLPAQGETGGGDKRQPINCKDLQAMVTYCGALLTDFDASSFAKINQIRAVAVNGAARF